jgi:hypothetical protein
MSWCDVSCICAVHWFCGIGYTNGVSAEVQPHVGLVVHFALPLTRSASQYLDTAFFLPAGLPSLPTHVGAVVQPHAMSLLTAADTTGIMLFLLLQRLPSSPTARPRLSWKA